MPGILDYLGEALGGLGYALDTPGALMRGGIESLVRALSDEEPDWGHRGDWGLLGNLAADPLNFAGGLGLAKKALGISKVAKENTIARGLLKSGGMPEEIAGLTKLVDEAGQPQRLYHATGAPQFGPREFRVDPGTNNWLGKGSYFTTRGDEPLMNYWDTDKSKSLLPFNYKGPEQIVAQREAIALAKKFPEVAWKTPMLSKHAGQGNLNVVEGSLRKSLNTSEWDQIVSRSPAAMSAEARLAVAEKRVKQVFGHLSARERDLGFDSTRETIHALLSERPEQWGDLSPRLQDAIENLDRVRKELWAADKELTSLPFQTRLDDLTHSAREAVKEATPKPAPRTMMAYADARNPFRFGETAKFPDIEVLLAKLPEKVQIRVSKIFDKVPHLKPTNADLHALGKAYIGPDAMTDVLRSQGYDALSHAAGEQSIIHEFTPMEFKKHFGHKARTPNIDEHSEVVIFDPSRIYAPWIAPALQQNPRIAKLLAALLGYNTAKTALPSGEM